MITVTQPAQEQVKAYFADKDIQPVRIFLTQGCGGAQLAMALDEKRESDAVFEFSCVEYIMDNSLLDEAKPVEVGYSGAGFHLSSNLDLSSGCSSCGTKGSCCS
ncbi:MAG: IscA/HesB family protein [Desulfamplus sp.]|nr:IscA/HesB family protein [Desulfamplus sp.]